VNLASKKVAKANNEQKIPAAEGKKKEKAKGRKDLEEWQAWKRKGRKMPATLEKCQDEKPSPGETCLSGGACGEGGEKNPYRLEDNQ